MSGGYFNYQQNVIKDIADSIEKIINNDEYWKDWTNLTDKEMIEFKNAVKILKLAYIYAHGIDMLLSCDYSEDTFHKYLKEQLEQRGE